MAAAEPRYAATMSTKEVITPEILESAERQVAILQAHGVECTVDEIITASTLSNLVETTIVLNPEMATKGTKRLASPTSDGLMLCLTLVRALPLIRAAETLEQQAAALNQGVTPVLAELTKSKAKDFSKLGR
jgi:maleate cis-trans isomerase